MYLIKLVGKETVFTTEYPLFELRSTEDKSFKVRFSRPRLQEVLSHVGMSGNQIGSVLRVLNKNYPAEPGNSEVYRPYVGADSYEAWCMHFRNSAKTGPGLDN